MAKVPDHIDPKLIRRYLEGEITGSEAHELEKRILDHAFESDALEGLADMDPADYRQDMESLELRLNERIGKRSRGSFGQNFWRIAASLLLIAVSGYTAWYFIQPDLLDTGTLTENELSEPAAEGISPPPDSISIALVTPAEYQDSRGEDSEQVDREVAPLASQTLEETLPKEEETETEERTEPVDPDLSKVPISAEGAGVSSVTDTTVSPENAIQGQTTGLDETKLKDLADEQQVTQQVLEVERRAASQSRAKWTEAPPSVAATQVPPLSTIRGRLTGESPADPLIGADIQVKGTSTGTLTDIEGNYMIDAGPGNTLVFSYVGYLSKEVEVSDQMEVNISLDPDVSELAEVVITGYAMKMDSPEVIKTSAMPEGGYPALRDHIRRNLVYPEEARANNISGRVVILFTVNADGTLGNFRVKRSLGYGCDEEAIRLVREGPGWSPSMENEEKVVDEVRVTVRFN